MLLVTSHSPPSRAKRPSVVTSSTLGAAISPPSAAPPSAAPRPAPSCGTPPRRRRAGSSRTRTPSSRQTLQVQVDQHGGKSRDGQAVAVPDGLERPAPAEELDHGQVEPHLGRRDAHLHHGPRQVTGEEGLLETSGWPTASMHTSAPKPPVTLRTASTGSSSAALTVWVAPKPRAHGQLPVVEVDADDRGGAGQPRPAMAASPTPPQPKTATVSPRPTSPVSMAAPRPAMTPQPSRPATLGPDRGVHRRALPGRHQRLLGEGPDAQRGRELGAVGQRHLLRGVVGGEAVPGAAALAARPALAAHRPPVEDHEVAGRHVGHPRRPTASTTPAASWPSRNGKSSLIPPSR